jgi:hypothetical protein
MLPSSGPISRFASHSFYGRTSICRSDVLNCAVRGDELVQVDVFDIVSHDIGNLETITIGFDNSANPKASWHCKQIDVKCPGREWVAFPCNRWFDAADDGNNLQRVLHPEGSGLSIKVEMRMLRSLRMAVARRPATCDRLTVSVLACNRTTRFRLSCTHRTSKARDAQLPLRLSYLGLWERPGSSCLKTLKGLLSVARCESRRWTSSPTSELGSTACRGLNAARLVSG